MDDTGNVVFTLLIVGIMVAFAIFVASTLNYSHVTPIKPPLNCGVTEYNHSESYTTSSMCGKTMCTYTNYYKDLVCTNGTTVFRYGK